MSENGVEGAAQGSDQKQPQAFSADVTAVMEEPVISIGVPSPLENDHLAIG